MAPGQRQVGARSGGDAMPPKMLGNHASRAGTCGRYVCAGSRCAPTPVGEADAGSQARCALRIGLVRHLSVPGSGTASATGTLISSRNPHSDGCLPRMSALRAPPPHKDRRAGSNLVGTHPVRLDVELHGDPRGLREQRRTRIDVAPAGSARRTAGRQVGPVRHRRVPVHAARRALPQDAP